MGKLRPGRGIVLAMVTQVIKYNLDTDKLIEPLGQILVLAALWLWATCYTMEAFISPCVKWQITMVCDVKWGVILQKAINTDLLLSLPIKLLDAATHCEDLGFLIQKWDNNNSYDQTAFITRMKELCTIKKPKHFIHQIHRKL